jgi:hypothetical protein
MLARWKTHVSHAKNSKGGRWHFPNAIRLYSPEAFEHRVIRVFESLDDANLAEKCLIKRWKTRDPKYGFNLAPGGKHVPHPIKNPWNNPEYCAKAALASKTRWQDPVIRAKNVAAAKAGLNTPESKLKRSVSSKEVQSRHEVKEKASLRSKKLWLDPVFRAKCIASQKTVYNTPEFRAKKSIISKEVHSRPEVIAKMALVTESNKLREYSPEYRAKLSKAQTRYLFLKQKISKTAKKQMMHHPVSICANGKSLIR